MLKKLDLSAVQFLQNRILVQYVSPTVSKFKQNYFVRGEMLCVMWWCWWWWRRWRQRRHQ